MTKGGPVKRAKAKRGVARKRSVAKADTVLVLRTCNADMTAHGGFRWPTSGPVSCSDWKPTATCGNGLHGLLWGEGSGELLSWDESAKWLVVEVAASDVVEIDKQKCKFPSGVVVFCGKADDAVKYLQERAPAGKIIVRGTATAGDRGTATAGDRGTATAGDRGTATAGDRGTATAGDGGTATAGDRGEIRIRHWDDRAQRYRTAIGYVGEGGITPGVAYWVRDGKIAAKPKEQP